MHNLPTLIFIQNPTDARIEMAFQRGIESAYELFMLCIDLFIKGLVIARSLLTNTIISDENEGNTIRIDVDSITRDELQYVIRKLSNAGIVISVTTQDLNSQIVNGRVPIRGRIWIALDGNESRIESYSLMLTTRDSQHCVKVGIQHTHKSHCSRPWT